MFFFFSFHENFRFSCRDVCWSVYESDSSMQTMVKFCIITLNTNTHCVFCVCQQCLKKNEDMKKQQKNNKNININTQIPPKQWIEEQRSTSQSTVHRTSKYNACISYHQTVRVSSQRIVIPHFYKGKPFSLVDFLFIWFNFYTD